MKPIYFSFLFLLLTACGGGSSGDSIGSSSGVSFEGNNAPASIDDTNAEEIGVAAGESVQSAANSSVIPSGISIESEFDYSVINNIVKEHAQTVLLPSGATVVLDDLCITGSVTANIPNVSSGPVKVTFTYNNCRMSGSDITANGKATIHYFNIADVNSGFTINYSNFKVQSTSNGSYTINLFMDCSDVNNCTYNSDFVGSDGKTHRVSALSFTGNASSGYNGTATFYHSTYGRTTISATFVTYGNCGSHPDGGSISFTSTTGSSGTITFNSNCTVSGTWTSGGLSGSF